MPSKTKSWSCISGGTPSTSRLPRHCSRCSQADFTCFRLGKAARLSFELRQLVLYEVVNRSSSSRIVYSDWQIFAKPATSISNRQSGFAAIRFLPSKNSTMTTTDDARAGRIAWASDDGIIECRLVPRSDCEYLVRVDIGAWQFSSVVFDSAAAVAEVARLRRFLIQVDSLPSVTAPVVPGERTLYRFDRRSDGSPMRIDLSFWPVAHLWKVTVFRYDREVFS